MIANYFKIAWRNIRTGGWYTALNIGGLSVVLTVSLLLFWWVQDELSFDRFHSDSDRIYQINAHFGKAGDKNTFTSTPAPLASIAHSELPEIESVTRIGDERGSGIYRANGNSFNEKGKIAFADSNFLDIFSGFTVLHGNQRRPFTTPNSVVLTEKLARKFFGTDLAVGKILTQVETKTVFIVSAVLANIPEHSSIRNDMFINMEVRKRLNQEKSDKKPMDENWEDYGFGTYIKLIPGTNADNVGTKLTAIQRDNIKMDNIPDYLLQPLTDIHLYPVEGNEGTMQQVKILGLMAVFLLSIGCINYVNLTTARASRRSKEVGIRKVVGAQTRQLAIQLFIESLLTLVFALFLSLILLPCFLPFYTDVTSKSVNVSMFDPKMWQVLIGTLFSCFVLAGIYPALMVARFSPIQSLRVRTSQAGGAGVRKSLVVIQFTLSTILIIGTLVIGNQLRFIRERNPGFNRHHIFTFQGRTFTPQIKQSLIAESSVLGISTSTDTPVSVSNGTVTIDWDGKDKERTVMMAQMGIDKDFIPNLAMKIVAGRNFEGTKADSAHYILNESAIKQAGITDPIGKRFSREGVNGIIIGVVKDFANTSVREPIWPLMLYHNPDQNYMVQVRTSGELTPLALKKAETIWKKYSPEYPFEYTFLDADYDNLYRGEQQSGKLFNFLPV